MHMPDNEVIRVLIVDEHLMVRMGLRAMLTVFDDFEVVGEACDLDETLALCASLSPHVILMDVIKPAQKGFERLSRVHEKFPNIRLMAFSSNNETSLINAAIHAGATSYMLKNVTLAGLAEAIRATAKGHSVVAAEAMTKLMTATNRPSRHDFRLTEREVEVLRSMSQGMTNQEIADSLTVSRSTVKFHITNILSKLGATHRSQAIALAHEHKLI